MSDGLLDLSLAAKSDRKRLDVAEASARTPRSSWLFRAWRWLARLLR